MYKLICMSFDGEYQKERQEFRTIDEAWNYSNDLGSKWYFYPFHFVVSNSYQTIIDAPFPLDFMKGKRAKTVAKIFEQASKREDTQGMNCEQYAFNLEA